MRLYMWGILAGSIYVIAMMILGVVVTARDGQFTYTLGFALLAAVLAVLIWGLLRRLKNYRP